MVPGGARPGYGHAFFIYPGYIYFVAAVHRLTGESLVGCRAREFCGAWDRHGIGLRNRLPPDHQARRPDRGGWLLALQQLDFVRYYTMTLLSENLFFLLVP